MKIFVLAAIIFTTLVGTKAEKAPGSILRLDLLASVNLNHVRIITKPRIGFNPLIDVPSIWKLDEYCEDVSAANYIANALDPGFDLSVLASLTGFNLWPEKLDISLAADINLDVRFPIGIGCLHNITGSTSLTLNAGIDRYNVYLASALLLDANLSLNLHRLLEFHNQDIVGLIHDVGLLYDTEAFLGINAAVTYGPHNHRNLLLGDLLGGNGDGEVLDAEVNVTLDDGLDVNATVDVLDDTLGVDANVTLDENGLDVGLGIYLLRRWEYALNCDARPDPTTCGVPINIDVNLPIETQPGSQGDPHFKTWKSEHYEYHGQCDIMLLKDPTFAHGAGLEIQIRTKLVRYWSYIKNAAIRIGTDVLEVQGNSDPAKSLSYWHNFKNQAPLETIGGFPVTMPKQPSARVKANKKMIRIDLDSIYPGQAIVIETWNEFVRVNFEHPTAESFGNSVGMLGNFHSGRTLARDGATIINDFIELGNEWQVLPSEDMLFHVTEEPQFPEKCLEPEEPRGSRHRRLAESSITEEEAEKACATLKDALDRKDCIYDILATQDLDMAGAY